MSSLACVSRIEYRIFLGVACPSYVQPPFLFYLALTHFSIARWRCIACRIIDVEYSRFLIPWAVSIWLGNDIFRQAESLLRSLRLIVIAKPTVHVFGNLCWCFPLNVFLDLFLFLQNTRSFLLGTGICFDVLILRARSLLLLRFGHDQLSLLRGRLIFGLISSLVSGDHVVDL